MSWGVCYAGSNNIHFDFPAIMNDTRHFTDYFPDADKNQQILQQNGIQNNHQYRQFLIHHGREVMEQNRHQTYQNCGVYYYGYPLQGNDTRPSSERQGKYLFRSPRDFHQPYGYENSDLKQIYHRREALQSRLETPLLSQEQLLKLPRG